MWALLLIQYAACTALWCALDASTFVAAEQSNAGRKRRPDREHARSAGICKLSRASQKGVTMWHMVICEASAIRAVLSLVFTEMQAWYGLLHWYVSEILRDVVQDLFLESGKYMRDNILKDFPPEFRATTKQSNVSETYDMMTRPNMDKHVFMRVLEDRGDIELDADGWELHSCTSA